MDDDTLAKVELQRLELEANIAKLRQSLRHWQTLEIDYEGLKEEFLGLPGDSSPAQCLKAAQEFKPHLIDDNELRTLVGSDKNGRHSLQLVDLLAKRVNYVTKNVSTLRKQLSEAERKRNALLLAEEPEFRDDAGLPLAEITEELDDEGNITSSRVRNPGQDAPTLVDVLRKAGVSDLKDGDARDIVEDDKVSELSDSDVEEIPRLMAIDDKQAVRGETQAGSLTSDALSSTNPNDTEEDAALRQEMLQYGLDEVGAIVAELDILDDAGNLSFDDEGGEGELDFDSEDEDLYSDESDDETGKAKNPVISDRYRRQMEELQQKLGLQEIKNLGPAPDLPINVKDQLDKPPAAEAAGKAALARQEALASVMKGSKASEPLSKKESKRTGKKVAFAEALDIAVEEPPASTQQTALKPAESATRPVEESIIERITNAQHSTATTPNGPSPSTPTKPSRFKSARTETPQTPMFPPPMTFPDTKPTPTPPAGRTVATTLVERPASKRSSAVAPDPDDFDEELHRREIAAEYHKLRNRRMHEQGGFIRGGKEENYGEETVAAESYIEDEDTGKTRKISRFKAARLNQ